MTDDFTARRPRRKSGWKRPRHILGLWARLALSVAVIGICVFLGVCVVTKAVKPYREISSQRAQLAETLRRSDELAAQNAQLARRIAYLRTGDGIAAEARKMGYLRPGEYPIVVEGLKPGLAYQSAPVGDGLSGPAPAAGSVPAAPQAGPVRRFWQHLTGH